MKIIQLPKILFLKKKVAMWLERNIHKENKWYKDPQIYIIMRMQNKLN